MRCITRIAIRSLVLGAAMGIAPIGVPAAQGQFGDGDRVGERKVDPRARTMAAVMRPITVDLDGVSLEEFVRFIETVADINIEPFWEDDRSDVGLARDAEVSVSVEDTTIINLIERVLRNVSRDEFEETTWQLGLDGELEIGHKSRLNGKKTRKIYYILDIIAEIPNFNSAPDLSLDQILGGQTGGGSPFEDDEDDEGWPEDTTDRRERAEALMDLIEELVEPDQWGDPRGPRMAFFRNSLIVTAPDYIHRQLGGYPWIPSSYSPYVGETPSARNGAGAGDGTALADSGAGSDDVASTRGGIDNHSRMR